MTTENSIKKNAFASKNISLFLWFRIFFNCRFYYPILAIFFVDLGLSLSQYIILNVIWAVTIVLLEVPSGALADILGRKRLVVASALIMVIEMALLVFAPINGGWVLFSVCAVNRVLAGVAEAAASGSDEALAYDSLEGEKKTEQWDEVLSSLGRRMSIGMALAVALGALLYDQSTFIWLENTLSIPQINNSIIIRIPVFLCMLQGIIALFIALKLKEKPIDKKTRQSLRAIVNQTLQSLQWVWVTKTAFFLIIGTMIIDACTRNFATLTSSYYRYIQLPELTYGFIGAGIALCGYVVPYYAKPLAQRHSVFTNIAIVSGLALIGLSGLAIFKNAWGIIPSVIVMLCLKQTYFIVSRFLNQLTSPDIRATVLSVKGLFFNLGYAGFAFLFANTLNWRKESFSDQEALRDILFYTPIFIACCLLVFAICVYLFCRGGKTSSAK